ncbi:MAG: dockerin type I repeat-containing protein [Ruminococcus flavefaciens]|nr:dockerin type I repeat-containing protein [Ruminococcus flavefaciens]MCM1062327.1 dockerin type I repeat-containing protein [Eubacterium sp.]
MKGLKRLTSVLLTAIMSVASVGNMISVSAESTDVSEDAFYAKRYCFYAHANTYIAKFNANVSYNPNITICTVNNVGDIGGEFKVNDIEITDTQNIVYVNYINSSPTNLSGYMGFVDFVSSQEIYPDVKDINITSLKNDRGNELAKSNIYIGVLDMGDVNVDGVVNMEDFELLNKAIAGTYEPTVTGLLQADMDGDGEITFKDATQLLRYLRGLLR